MIRAADTGKTDIAPTKGRAATAAGCSTAFELTCVRPMGAARCAAGPGVFGVTTVWVPQQMPWEVRDRADAVQFCLLRTGNMRSHRLRNLRFGIRVATTCTMAACVKGPPVVQFSCAACRLSPINDCSAAVMCTKVQSSRRQQQMKISTTKRFGLRKTFSAIGLAAVSMGSLANSAANTFFEVTVRPGASVVCASSPCTVYFEAPAGAHPRHPAERHGQSGRGSWRTARVAR